MNQRFGLFERFMMENDFEYGEWLKKLGALDGCNGEPTSFKVSESLIFSPIIRSGAAAPMPRSTKDMFTELASLAECSDRSSYLHRSSLACHETQSNQRK